MTEQEEKVLRKAIGRLADPSLLGKPNNIAYVLGLLDSLLEDETEKTQKAKLGICSIHLPA